MFETIIFEKKAQVGWLKLNRPDKMNAFNEQMHREILEALKLAKKDNEIRSLVITGEGRAFNAGQDLSEAVEGLDYGDLIRKRYNPMIKAIVELEKPVIAAVNGVAAGAGLSLALACDFRLASSKSSFVNAFIHVGLVPDSGNLYFLPRIVGYAKALELSVLGEKVTAEEAHRLGLVTRVIPAENWSSEVEAFAMHLASLPTRTIGLIKRYMQESFENNLPTVLEFEANAQRIAGKTADHLEGVTAFLEKRRPSFTGK